MTKARKVDRKGILVTEFVLIEVIARIVQLVGWIMRWCLSPPVKKMKVKANMRDFSSNYFRSNGRFEFVQQRATINTDRT